jgi:hypothetical protein
MTTLDWIAVAMVGMMVAKLGLVIPFLLAPTFRAMFADLGGDLPWLTRGVVAGWLPVALATVPSALLVVGVAKRSLSVKVRRAALVAGFAAGAAAIALCLAGLYLPVLEMAGNIRAE